MGSRSGVRRAVLDGGLACAMLLAAGSVWAIELPLVQLQELIPSDTAAGDHCGASVAADGDTLVVGAFYNDHSGNENAGAAYVFVRSGETWSEQAKLIAGDPGAFDGFGMRVGISGDTVTVGAPGDDNAAGANAGAVYVFVRSGTAWSEQQKLVPSDAAPEDHLGRGLAISGDTIVAGAYEIFAGPGSAYVFVRAGATWSEQQKLVASDPSMGDEFGVSAALNGDTAVIGAWQNGGGAAYVFERSGTMWSETTKLTGSGGLFGTSAAIATDTIVVGAKGNHGPSGLGAAHVFVRSGPGWSLQQSLNANDAASGDWFGVSVSAFGDTVLVGARGDDNVGGADAGSAYVFMRSGTTWGEQQKLVAGDAAPGDWFGESVFLAPDLAVIGAVLDQSAGGPGAGSAYVFTPQILINEVDADQGTTDNAEFVELYGPPNASLDGLVLVFFDGASDTSYAAFDLDGHSLDGGGFFVLCTDAANVPNCTWDVTPDTDLLHDGADAVTLYRDDAATFPDGSAVTTANLVDALVYDTNDADDSGLLTLLIPGQTQVNEGAVDSTIDSNQRFENGAGLPRSTDTYTQDPPTPNGWNTQVELLSFMVE